MSEQVIKGQNKLSEREVQVARAVVSGMSSKEVALKFGLSVHTVRNHRKNIMRKLGVKKSLAWIQHVEADEKSMP